MRLSVWQRAGRAVGVASMGRPALCAGSPAVLGLMNPSRNSLRSLRSLRSNSRDESEHVARCARGSRALCSSAPHRRAPAGPTAPLQPTRWRNGRWWDTVVASRWGVLAGGDLGSAEKRRAMGGARSALRGLTRRNCLSGVSAANEASFSARPSSEHRRGAGAQRRPLPYEPPANTPRRDAQAEASRNPLKPSTPASSSRSTAPAARTGKWRSPRPRRS